jgi:tRNA(Leu) C34 or U34 (ribose-2'-O)-methylase TrmL
MNTYTGGREPRLGIDIGRVIIDGSAHRGGGDTAFFTGHEAAMLATPEMPGAVETIARLVARFDGRVWLVSKCGDRVRARTLRWLAGHDFAARTGVPADHVRFCRTRKDKRRHCLELGLTHFVDDHPEVHAAIRGAVEHQYLFGPQRRPVQHARHAATWADVERLVRESLAGADRAG